jgi:hypothetical protein
VWRCGAEPPTRPHPAAGGSTPSDRASVAAEEGGLAIGSPGNPVEQPLLDDIPAIESGLDPEPGPLRLYNWADYVYKDTLDKFAKKFDVEYELTTFYNLDGRCGSSPPASSGPTSSSRRPRCCPSTWPASCSNR